MNSAIPLILQSRKTAPFDESALGGKAFNLGWLSRNGLPVPAWFVLTTTAYDRQWQQWQDDLFIQKQLQQLGKAPDKANDLHTYLCQQPLHPDIVAGIRGCLNDPAFQTACAVRSSAVGEDSSQASFAGQLDSLLFRQGIESLSEAVVHCYASAFSPRAVAYRLQQGLSPVATQVAVIVQTMVVGEVSGVFFTAHPGNGRRDQGLIAACYGLGEGIVSGACKTDEFTVSLHNDTIDAHIENKDTQLLYDDAHDTSGTKAFAVPAERRSAPCLSTRQLLWLRDYGRKIAYCLQSPQDIEWTLHEGRFYFLQTRPITALPAPVKPKGDTIVWDNSNIQESYCGVTTPLTFSFARRAYATVYEQTYRLLDPSERRLRTLHPVFNNLLGLVKGRVYYNINNWYRGLLFLPSFTKNKADMERMMGLQDPVDFVEDLPGSLWTRLCRLPRMIRALGKLLNKFRHMDQWVAQFDAHFQQHYRRVDRGRLHTLEIAELMALANELDKGLLHHWQTPIINDFCVMMSNGRMHRWLKGAGLATADELQNRLMAGEPGIQSTEPTKCLMAISEKIRTDPHCLHSVLSTPNTQVLAALQTKAPQIYADCLDYIERYGDRCMGELKLESVTLRQNPAFLFVMLKNYLRRPDLTLATLSGNEQHVRTTAETDALACIEQHYGRRRLKRFKKVLAQLRQAVKNRENMRLARTRLFGLYRDIYLEIGRQMACYGILAQSRDIFYLTVEELDAYAQGRSVQTDFKALTAARKIEFEAYAQETLPHHFITHGLPYLHNAYVYPYAPKIAQEGEALRGIGCYPGVVEGRIRLVLSPEDAGELDGCILCTVRTDPGWTPLFPTVVGIIVERGSTLSHSAVIARELGIPAIVNVSDVTQQLRDGEQVRMDGASGVIVRLADVTKDQEVKENGMGHRPVSA